MKGNAIGQLSKPRVGREDWHDFKASSISPEVMMFFNSVPDHLEEIIEAAHYGNVDKVIALLKAESADENALGKDSMGCNLLLHAAAKGHADIVLELKKLKSIEDQAKAVNRLSGANALMAAASNDHPKVVKELLTLSSADSMARAIDHRRMNALMRAANRGSAAVIKLLAEMQSADDQATAIDAMGSNALRASAARGHLGVVDILINMRSGDEQALSVPCALCLHLTQPMQASPSEAPQGASVGVLTIAPLFSAAGTTPAQAAVSDSADAVDGLPSYSVSQSTPVSQVSFDWPERRTCSRPQASSQRVRRGSVRSTAILWPRY